MFGEGNLSNVLDFFEAQSVTQRLSMYNVHILEVLLHYQN